jgi:hypothetical protein
LNSEPDGAKAETSAARQKKAPVVTKPLIEPFVRQRTKEKMDGKAKAPVAATHAPVVTVAAITPAYLDIKQAALFLGPTTGTISRLIENKDLVCAKIGKRFIVKRELHQRVKILRQLLQNVAKVSFRKFALPDVVSRLAANRKVRNVSEVDFLRFLAGVI